MANNPTHKIGEIKLSVAQRQVIAEFVESDAYKVLSKVIRPQRQVKIALTSLNLASSESDQFFYKGKSSEHDWLVKFLKETAEKYHKDEANDKV